MSEYDGERSQMQQNASSDDTFEDSAGGANNSIIGKVKSRVSSIFPNSLSKWFSPSTKSDSINGNLSGGVARRRRRIEVEDDEDAEEEEDDNDEQHQGEYNESLLSRQHDDDKFDEESQNRRDILAANAFSLNTRRNLNTTSAVQQPPSKRSRLNLVVTSSRDSPLVPSRPIVASTPAVSSNVRGGISQLPSTQMGRNASNRYTHLNLYSNKEPAYDFESSSEKQIPHEPTNGPPLQMTELNAGECSAMSSRRSLNIPSTSQATTERYITTASSNLRRQSLATFKNDSPSTSSGIGNFKAAFPMRTSTTLLETEGVDGDDADDIIIEETAEGIAEEPTKYNGRPVTSSFMTGKRQKLINGLGVVDGTDFANKAGNLPDDSASESSEGGEVGGTTEIPQSTSIQGRKTGLFNMSGSNSRNCSRTSSFGNGLNFYTHLEGRKSLFAGGAKGNALNNSTLSLTSLNRRQFNASIYGSTSALSDSRLLNTFSPFYKGKTTYGGAAAYNRYAKGTGAGASAVRITPTLIRPTSSLSTLSSSSLSLTAAGAANANTENSSAISSTAKRILDLINDFATPLSEAKKMASNLKANQQQLLLPQAKARLNDSDLQATRAIRLAQVRTPYMRPAVTLQTTMITQVNGNASSILPPVRELQVPSMSQLLQMKKMQTNTERARQIATHNSPAVPSLLGEYTLPIIENRGSDSQRQKHTNKIKNKVNSSVRITASKDAATVALADIAQPPINLPNIAFPLMQSVPKIDIKLPTSSSAAISSNSTTVKFKFGTGGKSNATDAAVATSAISSDATYAFNTNNSGAASKLPITPTTNSYVGGMLQSSTKITAATNVATTNFQFSAPLELKGLTTPTQNIAPINGNYKFSPPTLVPDVNKTTLSPPFKKLGAMVASPQLKTGSVLDALKQSFEKTPDVTTISNAFGCQFKKSTTEWECDTCMICNKQESSKCIACETPRPTAPIVAKNVPLATSLSSSQAFGSQFKKSGNEWECDTCMIRNKQEANKCVACETLRKCTAPFAITDMPITIQNSFGDSFKPKANTWECATCLITNKSESNACVACETKKPGSSSSSIAPAPTGGGTIKFGFAAAVPIATATSDSGFKSLAAEQKASKWECEACMTRNDATRVKCVCCEQAKPGSQSTTQDVPKFAFGSSAASKFSFGFGASASKEEDLRKAAALTVSTTTTISATRTTNRKTETAVAVPPSSGGFTFGIKPTATIVACKDVADAIKPTSNTIGGDAGFKFGTNTSIAASATSNATAGFTFGTKPVETASKDNTSSAPSVKFNLPTTISAGITTTSETAVKCNLPIETTTATVPTDNMAANKGNTTLAPAFTFGSSVASPTTNSFKPGGGFSFGTPSNHVDSTKAAANTTVAPAGGFAFKTSAAAPATTTSDGDGAASLIKTPSFGSATAASKASSFTPASATTTTPATSSTFGNFGSFAGQNETKASVLPTMPLFGGVSNSVAVTPAVRSFVFGSATPSASAAATTTTSNTSSITSASAATTTASTWPKNSFVFGAATAPSKNAAAVSSTNDVTKSVFGNFGTAAANDSTTTQPAPSIFGNMASSSISSVPIASTFGNSSTSGTNIFGSNSASGATTTANANAATVSSTNPFSAPPSGNATTPAPAFGSSPFGGSSSSTSAVAPTFGSTATTRLPTSTFGSFGSAAAATDGASAAKKSDQAFNFGAPTATAAAQSTSGGFNFGSGGQVAKPAFNFAPSNQLAFNFTGGSSEKQPQTVQPFQFGATPSAPVFNFSGGAVEAAPNAPFQFNAGTAPASNNIFAPPAPTAGAQTGQQIRRKIRAPIRRLTPR